MNKTKKLPHSMTKDGRACRGGEHLVPCLEMPRQNVFIGIKTGKKYDKGYLVYLGVDISADDILKKIGITDRATEVDRNAMETFLQALHEFKIGNIVSFQFTAPDSCVLKKEAEYPKIVTMKNKLPE